MTGILSATVPIVLVIAFGYAIGRFGVLSRADFGALGRYVVNLALPALVFRSLATNPVSAVFDPVYMASYLVGSVALALAGHRLLSRRQGGEAAAIGAMGMVCPNSGFVGYPVNLILFPALAGPVLAQNMIVENIVLIPLTLFLAEQARQPGSAALATLKPVFLRLLRSPLIVAILAGALWSLGGLSFPAMLMKPLDLVAASSGAVSLVVIGGMLARGAQPARALEMLPVIAGKLVVHPLAVGLAVAAFASAGFALRSPDMLAALLLTAAMPMMGIYPLLATRHGREEEAAMALVVATVASFATINLLLLALGSIAA